ncbi:MAG: hypothetical protein JXR10_03690 [Cyclobacteriaceae bacterium]
MLKEILVALLLLGAISSSAQFFSGKYHSEPSLDEFDHLKIHHHHSPHHKYEGDLSVKGYSEYSELWEIKANMITGEKADFFIEKFGGDEEIQTVYEFKIELDGIEEDYILLGYENEQGHGRFIAIEEVFADASEEEMLSLKTFKLVKKH